MQIAALKSNKVAILVIAVLCAIAFRRYDALVNPQFWAEDGNLFFQSFYNFGAFKSIITPYAGYHNLAQRLIVAFYGGIGFNLLYIPAFYAYTCLVIYLLLAYRLWRSAAHINMNNRIAYAVMFLFVPVTSDVFMNITNLNGILSLYLINRLFIKEHGIKTTAGKVLDVVVTIIIGLSGPTSIVLAPVAFLIAFLERRELKASRITALALIFICGCIQLFYVLFIDNHFFRGIEGAPESMHLLRFFTKNTGDLMYIDRLGLPHGLQFIISLGVFVAFVVFFAYRYARLQNRNKYIILLTCVLYLLSVIRSYWPNESMLLAMGNASRYCLVPYTCIAWLLLLSLDGKIKNLHIGAYLLFFILHRPHIRTELPDMHWKWQVMEYREGKRQEFEINPGWKFTIPPYEKK